jgi:hypothetical protein
MRIVSLSQASHGQPWTPDAAGAKELREGDQQVVGKDEDFSYRANRAITASTCKTSRLVRIASHWEFATHRSGRYTQRSASPSTSRR